MHGDDVAGKQHDESEHKHDHSHDGDARETGVPGMHEVIHKGMHGQDPMPVHEWDTSTNGDKVTQQEPSSGEKLMHGVLMHGDADFTHKSNEEVHASISSDENGGAAKPSLGEDLMHGVLMHGDSAHAHAHGGSDDVSDGSKTIGPDSAGLHGILMHGDSSIGHDHTEEDSKSKQEVFWDVRLIASMGLDEDLMKVIDLKKIIEKDQKEYADWILKNPQYQGEQMMGSSNAEVTDSVLKDIELMKKRYLEKNNLKLEEDVKGTKDIPFTAEDANAVLGEMGGHGKALEGEDMTHNLELLGSTEPLNARHKVKLELLKHHSDEK
ncbi:uncharacterized protein LOC127834786 [Dreissena polymorpha]|uniref:Uncharacterized protein n=1 Tax=Dreissena polymorpha TaxID=45954 RepID=A0A9D4JEM7_DREPO|nr:uncharacterized protein LOC127834786 [Dreissena polymorpha]KAH3804982.1 hypothetical protein DPMN_133274 [Dreissena polymorpha]